MKEKQLKALGAKFSGSSKSSPMMVSTLAEWYDAKHREASNDEISFINSPGSRLLPVLRVQKP